MSRKTSRRAVEPRPLRLKWSTHNRKLRKTKTISFNLPAWRSRDGFMVCPGAGGCQGVCYAQQNRYVLPDAQRTREHNLRIARKDLARFERWAIEDLRRLRAASIRLHDSGDFYSQEYLNAWFRIVAAFPEKAFYCYTKSLHLDWSRRPRNLTVVQSAGGKWDEQIDQTQSHARIFASHEDRVAAGYVDGNVNDRPAQRGEQRIGLVYHGGRNLTAAQVIWLQQAA